jgi:hydroxymethylpyrimidine kinase/phosphomethylpyrimidine kinase
MPLVLTIAGSDSSGRAGIQADLRTLALLGVHGATAITAITAQNTRGVTAIEAIAADLVTAQIESVAADALGATKIGMLATAAIVEAVAAAIEDLELPLVVLDPVLASTSGTRLLDDDGVQTLVLELLPRVLVVTPNLPEAEALSGVRIGSADDVRRAAKQLHAMGAANVVIKGGHRNAQAPTSSPQPPVIDLLFDGRDFHELRVARADRPNARGTGCSHSSALAAFLAMNDSLLTAAGKAQQHVARLIGSYTER